MNFDWNNLIPLAAYLTNNCIDLNSDECIDQEATFRTIINRSYYAAYNVAKQYVINEFTTISRKGGEHESLINMFKAFREENNEYPVIASKLDKIKSHRISADYHPIFNNSAIDTAARMSLKLSKEIIQSINEIENQSAS